MKEKIYTLTRKDFRWDYYRGSGSGGQKKNKTSNCVRCTHEPSGSVGKSENGRSQLHNKQTAFKRCTDTKKFKLWLKIELAKRDAENVTISKSILLSTGKIKTEVWNGNKWVETDELS